MAGSSFFNIISTHQFRVKRLETTCVIGWCVEILLKKGNERRYTQNDLAGWQFRVNCDVFAQATSCIAKLWKSCQNLETSTRGNKELDRRMCCLPGCFYVMSGAILVESQCLAVLATFSYDLWWSLANPKGVSLWNTWDVCHGSGPFFFIHLCSTKNTSRFGWYWNLCLIDVHFVSRT